jgi:hypothetical protein
VIDKFSIVEYTRLNRSSLYWYLAGRTRQESGSDPMELIWLMLSIVAVDLAAFLFAADSRPGFDSPLRRRDHRSASG